MASELVTIQLSGCTKSLLNLIQVRVHAVRRDGGRRQTLPGTNFAKGIDGESGTSGSIVL